MSKPAGKTRTPKKDGFPWILLVVLLATIYLFWILPGELGPRKVRVDFEASDKK